MRGFNPEIKASADGEAQIRTPETEVAGTLMDRLKQLSPEEREWLKQDALRTLNESEAIVHTLNAIDDAEVSPTLF